MIIKSEFQASWWLKNPHMQTLWSPLFRRTEPVQTRLQRLELDDGDFIDLDWVLAKNKQPSSPVLLLLHGLEGSADSVYIQNLLHSIKPYNWNTVVMNFRSCSRELNRLPRSYHSGETKDLTQVLEMLKGEFPDSPIIATGFSLGGNVILKYLGENKEKSMIDIAATVSVPFLLAKASLRMDKGFSRFYRNRLLGELKQKTRKKINKHGAEILPAGEALNNINTFYEFDDQITAPLHGFKNADDYYQRCSCRSFLKTIARPTLILHAEDDPFMTGDVIPRENELSAEVTLELSFNGGHVGFISGKSPWQSFSYIDRKIPVWLEAQLDKKR